MVTKFRFFAQPALVSPSAARHGAKRATVSATVPAVRIVSASFA